MTSGASPQVLALAHSSELSAFCTLLEQFLHTGEGEALLRARAAALAAEARARALPPEHILFALRVARCNVGHQPADSDRNRVVNHRYATGIAILLHHYFDVEDDAEAVGDVSRAMSPIEHEFRAEAAVRVVPDPETGALWRVSFVREGYSWDPEIELRRRDYLACETGEARRYISPAPADWLEWSDVVLLDAIRSASPDHRRPGH